MSKPRGRALGLRFAGTPGPFNAITDVPGVAVGMTTLIAGEGPLVQGRGPVRTGVTAILPFGHDRAPRPVAGGFFSFNGNGEMTGTHWLKDAGYFLGPICLTNTHAIGAVHHGAVKWIIDHHAQAWSNGHLWAMPVVAETYDGVLNDINGLHVTPEHALAAIAGATGGPVAEGNCGGGTGMIAYEFKGGTGTASRGLGIAGGAWHLGALVQANFGRRAGFTVLGVPVGRHIDDDLVYNGGEQGSIIAVIGTDLPLSPLQLTRLARRAALGIGRSGTIGGNGSGDIFIAFSTAHRLAMPDQAGAFITTAALNDELLDPVFGAAVEAVDEAVINAMLAAEDMESLRPAGRTVRALPHDRLMAVMARYGR